jgi:CheY-like chemotaxis protein
MSSKEIFHVEGSPEFRQLVRTIFKEFLPRYSVRSFQGGSELYQYMVMQSSDSYTGKLPSLIIMNINLPTLNGYELLKLIRQTPSNSSTDWKTIPVVMFGESESQEDVDRCYQAGANSFFLRPSEPDQLRNILETLCNQWLEHNPQTPPENNNTQQPGWI